MGFASSLASIDEEQRENEESKEKVANFPGGVHFSPSKKQLVVYYLMNKIFARKQPVNLIKLLHNLFLFDPDQLPTSDFKHGKKKKAYYYTFLEQKYLDGMQQEVRTTPTGQWKATGEVDEVIHEGKIVGLKKFFVFDKGNAPTELRTSWLMHEYSVHPSIIPIHKMRRCVVCKIQFKVTREIITQYDIGELIPELWVVWYRNCCQI